MAKANEDRIVCRKFYLTVISAKNLPNVRKESKTRAYAEVSIRSADKTIKRRTDVDRRNGLNPMWSHRMDFQIAESGVRYYGLTMVIKLYCERTRGDRAHSKGGSANLYWPIKNANVQKGGILNLAYSFGKRFTVGKGKF